MVFFLGNARSILCKFVTIKSAAALANQLGNDFYPRRFLVLSLLITPAAWAAPVVSQHNSSLWYAFHRQLNESLLSLYFLLPHSFAPCFWSATTSSLSPLGRMATSSSSLPLKCSVCPKRPNFSDVSHLLTHVASKGHLSHYYKIKVRASHDLAARSVIDGYDAWYDEWNVEELMSQRMHQKEQKRSRARNQGQSTPRVLIYSLTLNVFYFRANHVRVDWSPSTYTFSCSYRSSSTEKMEELQRQSC